MVLANRYAINLALSFHLSGFTIGMVLGGLARRSSNEWLSCGTKRTYYRTVETEKQQESYERQHMRDTSHWGDTWEASEGHVSLRRCLRGIWEAHKEETSEKHLRGISHWGSLDVTISCSTGVFRYLPKHQIENICIHIGIHIYIYINLYTFVCV